MEQGLVVKIDGCNLQVAVVRGKMIRLRSTRCEKVSLNQTRRVSDEVFDESFCEFFTPTEDCSTAAKLTGLGNTRKLSKMESFRGPQQA
jgi:hypothetical protein